MAAFVPALKREYVWDAIYDRLTYGTTGARILVSLKINSAPMGSEVKAIGDAPVTIEGSVLGTDTVTVELLRDNQVIQTWACAGNACDFTLEDTAGSGALLLPARHPEGRAHGLVQPHLGGPRLTPFPANEKRNGYAVPLFPICRSSVSTGLRTLCHSGSAPPGPAAGRPGAPFGEGRGPQGHAPAVLGS